MNKSEINPGHYLELMDRLYVLASTLHEHCLEHPLSEHDEEIYKAIETAIEATYDAYQLVGQKEEGYDNENHTY